MTVLIDMVNELNALAVRLSERSGREVTRRQILQALILRHEGLREIRATVEVWDLEASIEEIETLLSTFDFTELDAVVEHETIIPSEHQYHVRTIVKVNGEVWTIHKYDADPFPSDPHAHNFDHNLKLDLNTGACYRGRVFRFTLPRKELIEIRSRCEQRGIVLQALAV